MTEFTPGSALAGGAMIGLSAVLLWRLNGRIAGISGIVNGLVQSGISERAWRIAFVAGLLLGGWAFQQFTGQPLIGREGFSTAQLLLAGALVGFGTKLGNGCTSGHGVCGSARLSPRSLVATAVFVGVGMATATATYLLMRGPA